MWARELAEESQWKGEVKMMAWCFNGPTGDCKDDALFRFPCKAIFLIPSDGVSAHVRGVGQGADGKGKDASHCKQHIQGI